MAALDTSVEVARPHGDEGSPRPDETPGEYVSRLALEKARSVAQRQPQAVVLGADTTVVIDGEVLEKPADAAEATRMLKALRGRPHTVVTGVAVVDGRTGRWLSATRSTEVLMRRYSDEEIAAYVASGEPMDKAGAYAVQDERFHPAEDVAGCYLNVVGFPLCEVVRLLDRLGATVRLRQGWQPPEECRDCPLRTRQEVSHR
jgi:MAF protein